MSLLTHFTQPFGVTEIIILVPSAVLLGLALDRLPVLT